MLTYEFIVWLLFRALDTLIIVGVAARLILKKGLPAIRARIAAKRDREEALAQRVGSLERQSFDLDATLIADKQEIEHLEQQIRLWDQAVKRKQSRSTADATDIAMRLRKQHLERTEKIEKDKLNRAVFAQALDLAEQELNERTIDSQYVTSIIDYMTAATKEHA